MRLLVIVDSNDAVQIVAVQETNNKRRVEVVEMDEQQNAESVVIITVFCVAL